MKIKPFRRFALMVLVLLCVISSACRRADEHDGVDRVRFALDWTPNTNHSGLYLARERGFYKEESIDIEFVESDMNFIEMVASDAAAFGMAAQEQVLQARASMANIPVVAIAAVIQHNTSGFASPVDRGIKSARDFEGKTYSGWGTELELSILKTLMEQSGADFDAVKIINQSAGNFIASMETEADFAWIYYGWDGMICEQEDYPIHFIPINAIEALDFYSPVIITNEKTIRERPDLVRRFLKATAQGYTEAILHPKDAVASLMSEAPELDPVLLLESQRYLNERYIDDAPYWGAMDPRVWARFSTWMQEHELFDHPIDVEDAYDLSFLPKDG